LKTGAAPGKEETGKAPFVFVSDSGQNGPKGRGPHNAHGNGYGDWNKRSVPPKKNRIRQARRPLPVTCLDHRFILISTAAKRPGRGVFAGMANKTIGTAVGLAKVGR